MTEKISKKNSDKIERDKKFLMAAGTVFFLTLIFLLWGFNLKSDFDVSIVNDSQTEREIDELMSSLLNTVDDTKEEVKDFKVFASSTLSTEKALDDTVSSQEPETRTITTSHFLQELKERLEENIND